jgi:hypothetical protein
MPYKFEYKLSCVANRVIVCCAPDGLVCVHQWERKVRLSLANLVADRSTTSDFQAFICSGCPAYFFWKMYFKVRGI